MGLLDGLGFAWNAGGLKVDLSLGQRIFEGEPFSGQLMITGGTQPVPISGFDVRLSASWTSRDSEGNESTHTDTLVEIPIRQPGTVAPGARHTVAFHAVVPFGSGLLSRYEWYSARGSIDVPNARDPSCEQRVTFSPVRPIALLQDAMVAQSGWSSLLPYRESRMGSPWIKLRFKPPAQQKHLFDGLALYVQPTDPKFVTTATPPQPEHMRAAPAPSTPYVFADGTRCALAIELELNRQSKGLRGLLKEASGEDMVRDRIIVGDVESALARVAAMLSHFAALGPVR